MSSLVGVAERMAVAVYRFQRLPLLLFLTGFSSLALLVGTQKPLWYDEIVTLYICRLPSMPDVWSALVDSADANPPLFHLLTRVSMWIFGESPLALRLPSIVGFAVLCWSLFRFASKRLSHASAWAGVGSLFLTSAGYYMTEARPYGLVLGFSGFALVCWQSAAEGSKRSVSIAGMALSCTAALSCHYYGVLILVPLLAGELVRWRVNRRFDGPVVAALFAAAIPLAFYLPLIASAGTYGRNASATPSIGSILPIYGTLLSHGPLLLVGLAALALWCFVPERGAAHNTASAAEIRIPLHEAAAILMLLLTPLTTLCCAYLAGGFIDRYAILVTAGFALLVSLAVAWLSQSRPTVAVLSLLLVAGMFAAEEHFVIIRCLRGAESFRMPPILLRAADEGSVAIENPVACLQYQHYAPPEVRKNLYCIVDPERSRRITGNPSADTGLQRLSNWASIQTDNYESFLRDHAEFVVYQSRREQEFSWLLAQLSRDETANVRLIARSTREAVYHVQQTSDKTP